MKKAPVREKWRNDSFQSAKARKIMCFLVCTALVLGVVIFFTDAYKLFLKPLDIGEDISSNYGDVILVLGGGLRPQVKIGFSTEERLNLAIQLYGQKNRKIIISDGSLYRNSPAIKKMERYLLDRQVSKNHIYFEGESQTTFEGGQKSLQIINREKLKQVIVCTSPYHQSRSRMILKFLGYPDYKIARMHESEIYRTENFKQRLRNLKLIFRDYIAILKFKIFGN